jgi:hypothetical protein
MTSHSFQDWQDANDVLQPDDGQQASLNTLRDIYSLSTEDLPAQVAVARIQTIVQAALERLGVLPAEEDMIEPTTGWFEDEPPHTAA